MTIINIYAHGIEASKYMKQILKGVKGKINSNTVIVGDFNTPLLTKARSSAQINKETVELKTTIE